MIVLLLFAFLSGIITILSPCILPILPVILAGGVGGNKNRPLGIVLGFVVSFTIFTLALTALVQAFGISPDILRIVAVVIIILFGLVLIIPQFNKWFELLAGRVANIGRNRKRPRTGVQKNEGFRGILSGIPVGLSLGLVWTPCVGPIMASVITLALTRRLDGGAVFITLAYSLGTAIPMFLVMFTGRLILTRVPFLTKNMGKIQKVFGVLMIAVGVAIAFNWDRQIQAALLRIFPKYGTGLTSTENIAAVQNALAKRQDRTGTPDKENMFSYGNQPKYGRLENYGPAPEIVTDGTWLNSNGGFSMEDLRGKVVLLDFWTYSCINCIRTIPYLRSWYDTYKDRGFIVIGVHTPEFEFEKNAANVRKAMNDLGVNWPVVLDNDYAQWRAYANHYWPAHYFIDTQGNIRYFQYGEGDYETAEDVIRALLAEGGKELGKIKPKNEQKNETYTPETYLGYGREENFVSKTSIVRDSAEKYTWAGTLKNGEWTLEGTWKFKPDYIVPEDNGSLQLQFTAKHVYLVVEPEETGGTITVNLDGENVAKTEDVLNGILVPDESRLYELISLPEAGSHVLNLEINGRFRLFAFTFG